MCNISNGKEQKCCRYVLTTDVKKIQIEDNDVRNYENILNRKKCKIKDKIKKRKKN